MLLHKGIKGMNELIREGKRLAGLGEHTTVDCVLHPGERGEHGSVIFFLYSDGQPFCVAKVPRVDNSLTEREAASINAAASALAQSTLRPTIDRVLGTVEIGGRLVLYKEFRRGKPATRFLADKKPASVRSVVQNTCRWILQFIEDTKALRNYDYDSKLAAAQAVTSEPGSAWIKTFASSEHQFLGPAHGDLVPANMLMDGDKITTVVDFENFQVASFPLADFVGLIVSIATEVFGRGNEMVDATFRTTTWFSQEVARQTAQLCRLIGCELEEFVDMLPLYTDRAMSVATRWGMQAELDLHESLRKCFVSERETVVGVLRRTD